MLNADQIAMLNQHPILSDGFRHREIERHMTNGMSFDAAQKQTLDNFEGRKEAWLNTCIRPWAQKHGITEQQAISVLFFDNLKDGISSNDCFWAECHTFALLLMEKT
jgi:hypothetical protein